MDIDREGIVFHSKRNKFAIDKKVLAQI